MGSTKRDKTQRWKQSWWINQNPSTNGNQKVTDLKEKEKEKELKLPRLSLFKENYSFRAREWKLTVNDKHDKNEAAGPVKVDKGLHQNNRKHNGAGDQ